MSVDQQCDAVLADTFDSFPRLVPLFKALQRRFPKKNFPPKDTRKEFQMIDLLLDTIGGGAGVEVLQAYLPRTIGMPSLICGVPRRTVSL